ncbi:unnamed protein product, partial [Sphacelaria rigidula]
MRRVVTDEAPSHRTVFSPFSKSTSECIRTQQSWQIAHARHVHHQCHSSHVQIHRPTTASGENTTAPEGRAPLRRNLWVAKCLRRNARRFGGKNKPPEAFNPSGGNERILLWRVAH